MLLQPAGYLGEVPGVLIEGVVFVPRGIVISLLPRLLLQVLAELHPPSGAIRLNDCCAAAW